MKNNTKIGIMVKICGSCEPMPYHGLIFATIVIVGGFLLRWYCQGGKFKKATRCDGKIIIITGANAGIGKETALELAKRGGKIYMACRSVERANEARDEIIAKSGNQNIFVRELDLTSFESIKNFAKRFIEEEKELNILINNAGVMACPKSFTQDGLEMQMGVNHFGHFLLTNLLLDLLKKSEPSRIVNVSSRAHVRGAINKEDLNSEKSYDPMTNYRQSKLANVLFTKELARRLHLENAKVTTYSLHPGVVNTELFRNFDMMRINILRWLLKPIVLLVFKTPNNGCQTTLYTALDPDLVAVTGKYYADCKEVNPCKLAEDEDLAKWLWDQSEKIVGISPKAN